MASFLTVVREARMLNTPFGGAAIAPQRRAILRQDPDHDLPVDTLVDTLRQPNNVALDEVGAAPQEERIALLRQAPIFVLLPPDSLPPLAAALREEHFGMGEAVVREGECGDRLYLILSGRAEATTTGATGPVLLEAYHEGEVFGELALLLPNHTRQATVTATMELRVLSLDAATFDGVLTAYPQARVALERAETHLLAVKFLKAATPFARLDLDQIGRLAEGLRPLTVNPGDAIVREGEQGDECYLLRTGSVRVLATTEEGQERELATLYPGSVIGEAALLTDAPRNATVRALEPCDLLALRRSDLLAVVGADREIGHDLVELIQLRDRPRQVEGVVVGQRTSSDGTVITTLKNPRRAAYYRLSPQGYFVWERLDGQHTLRDITLEYVAQFKAFAPQAISDAIQGLAAAGFIEGRALRGEVAKSAVARPSAGQWLIMAARRCIDWQVSLPNPDTWLSRLYRSGVRFLFIPPVQVLLALLAIAGVAVFAANLGTAAHATRGGGWVLLLFFVMYFLMVVFHEAGHAFTVKFFRGEVPRVGVGWYWFGPIAYADTSDMWLTGRRQRIVVTLAGLYASVLVGAASAIAAVLLGGSVIAGVLWQLALLSLYGVLVNLNPLLELDGYFILMDALDRPNFRRQCLSWLGNDLAGALRNRAELRGHRLELLYGVGAVLYVLLSGFVLLIVVRPVVGGWLAQIVPRAAAGIIAWLLTGTLVVLTLTTLAGELRATRPGSGGKNSSV